MDCFMDCFIFVLYLFCRWVDGWPSESLADWHAGQSPGLGQRAWSTALGPRVQLQRPGSGIGLVPRGQGTGRSQSSAQSLRPSCPCQGLTRISRHLSAVAPAAGKLRRDIVSSTNSETTVTYCIGQPRQQTSCKETWTVDPIHH